MNDSVMLSEGHQAYGVEGVGGVENARWENPVLFQRSQGRSG